MLAFFNKKNDTIKEQETLFNVDQLILDLLKKKNEKGNKSENKKDDKNKIKKIYRQLNSFIES
jgi:hypothetical protein